MAWIEVVVRHEGVMAVVLIMLITADLGECAAPDVNCLTFRKNINV
jgi:hypothetical protein